MAGFIGSASASVAALAALGVPAEHTVSARNKRGREAGLALVSAAKKRGVTLVNHGAGVMPLDAAAPYGGQRYTLLGELEEGATVDSEEETKQVSASSAKAQGGGRDKVGKLVFPDWADFRPNFSPAQCIAAGIFGGCYFHPRGGKPGIFGPTVAVTHTEFPAAWFENVPIAMYRSRRYNVPTNKYRVLAGQDQTFWEGKGWIHAQDPRGWFQWYCRFFQGRRSEDDARQIKRWLACAGEKGRWRNQLCGKIKTQGKLVDDASVSPVIRQTLLHWAFELTKTDYEAWKKRKNA